MCKLLVYQSVYQYFLLQNFELDPVIRLFSTPFNFSWVSHPTKVPPTKVETLLRKVQWFSELPKVVGDVIYTWNPKQHKRMIGETTIFYIKIWNHPIETSIYKWLFGVPGSSLEFDNKNLWRLPKWFPHLPPATRNRSFTPRYWKPPGRRPAKTFRQSRSF